MSDVLKKIVNILIVINLFIFLVGYGYKTMKNNDTSPNTNVVEPVIDNGEDEENETVVEYGEDAIVYKTVVYNGYTYFLPEGYNYREGYEENGVKKLNFYSTDLPAWNAIVSLVDISSLDIAKDFLFYDYSYLKKMLMTDENIDGKEPQITKYGDVPVVIFHHYYERKNVIGRKLYAYIPAYDNYLYLIKLTSGKTVETFIFDYSSLELVVNFLSSGVKNS